MESCVRGTPVVRVWSTLSLEQWIDTGTCPERVQLEYHPFILFLGVICPYGSMPAMFPPHYSRLPAVSL